MRYINYNNEKLFLDEVSILNPTDYQIQIKVFSAGINRADILQKKGYYPPPKGESEIIGLECAGTVEKVGNLVQKFKIGDQVCAILGGGGYAEFVNVDERQVMPVPTTPLHAPTRRRPVVPGPAAVARFVFVFCCFVFV